MSEKPSEPLLEGWDDDDPLHPRRWMANWKTGGPISGDEYAYMKDLVARRMGVGNWDPEYERSLEVVTVPEKPTRFAWLRRVFGRNPRQ